VYEKPHILTQEAEAAFLEKLGDHIRRHRLGDFTILLHGGEPLLFGKSRFVRFVDELKYIEMSTRCVFKFGVTTNAVLIDSEWAQLFRIFGFRVTVSMDGPPSVHDVNRIDFAGQGTYSRVKRGIELLQDQGIQPSVLAVCTPDTSPDQICRHFVDELGVTRFDVMIPDATHEDGPPSIASYYKRLFDLWYDDYSRRGVSIRYVESLVKAILGGNSSSEAIGYGPVQLVTVLTDGSLEPLDVLRIAGHGSTQTNLSILTHTFQDVTENSVWLRAYNASLNLSDTCKGCDYQMACGGGYLPHRWSNARGFDNTSVYCSDLKEILGHVWDRVARDIEVGSGDDKTLLLDAVSPPSSYESSESIETAQ
jgi:uncharacterized protein